ncbi:protoporphyrinogen oxidase [Pedosphaera parvula]|uniref:protoporphyrinogen oxidase n=1 Tax=Pedosphaera parvula TaxID=1032527 RepID=UPI000307F53B|nr:protoporphyrinogen oxidase [Pedosphaera parvula]
MVDALQHQLADCIRLNNLVQELEEIPNGWRVFSKDGINEYGAVVLAAPAHCLTKVLLRTNSAPSLSFEEIKHPPIASIVLGFRRDKVAHPLDGFGVLVPAVEQMNILGVLFSSSLFPNRAPDGHVTLTCFVGGCRNPDLALTDRPALRRLVLEDLKRLLGVTGSPTFEHYSTFRQSIPQYDVGFGKFKELMNRIEASAPGLYFAGHYRDGISVGDSIASAEKAATQIVQFFKHSHSHTSPDLATA